MKRDLIVSLVVLVGIIALYLSLGHIEMEGARVFPRTIIIIMLVLSVLLLIQSALQKALDAKKGKFPVGRFFTCFGLIIVYFVFMESVGFYLSAFLFFVALTFILGRADLTLRTGLVRAGSGLAFTIVLFILFDLLLKAQTPKGLLI